ncbi:MAG: hypothetical protein SFU85_00330 [Candidatus Methylacidiphilales bacterium]|nr:hypothetical protein [Candidatus Methylacidiphilales bacterium]
MSLVWINGAITSPVSDLSQKIQSLPEQTPAEKLKKVVLMVACERLGSCPANDNRASVMATEIDAALAMPAEPFGTPASSARNLSVLRPPLTPVNNPYLDRLMAGARSSLAQPDVAWPVADTEPLFGSATSQGEYNPRDTAAKMEAFFWLFANPASPMKGDPEILDRLLQRLLAYADALANFSEIKGGQSVYDDFAISQAAITLREFTRLYPGLLLPSQKALIDQAMRTAGDKVMVYSAGHREFHTKGYANIHLAMSLELLNFGLYLEDAAMLEASRQLLYAQEKAILPDGGTHYIWSQNESCGYHDVIAQFFAQIHEISGDPQPLAWLKRLEWYGPVSIGRMAEYWTAPSWKHTWNSALKGIAGGEHVAGATGNPYVRGILGEPDPKPKDLRRWEQARIPVAWYRRDVKPLPLPDAVTYPDRNIDGPRAWYGRFSYAATLRDIPEDEPGHATLLGALIAQPDFSLQTFLMGVGPRVRVGAKADDPRSWAGLTSGMRSSRIIGRSFSAFTATYEMATFGSSQKGKLSGWNGRQLWLTLPDRLIGWMAVDPIKADAPPADLQAVIRLGTGGTVNGPKQTIKSLGPNEWSYGDFVVRVLEQNFAKVEPKLVPFRLPAFPTTEVTCEVASAKYAWCLVEVKPAWAQERAEVRHLLQPQEAAGFSVSLAGKRYWVAGNPGASEVTVQPPRTAGKAALFLSSQSAPAVPGPNGEPLKLAAHATAVLVENPSPDEQLPGWENFQQILAQKKPASSGTSKP